MKSSKFIYYILVGFAIAIVIWIAKESFSQPGIARFEGKYEELSTFRNENNTGPVIRIYAIKALDDSKDWMREYGDAMPHTKYGRTVVFFFSNEVDLEIDLSLKAPYFIESLQPHVLATYQKSPMGDVSFIDGYPK
ncbi:hypothetical protein LV84_04024 [Algoriphagus ratkowskyi]|uniref:Uncharacterized protein n=1 Tax=Algoriphagus ratkowskyi TaxID=57028 RepID=A0A2W7QR45_9BACT|nr:hypothetical protein [Algoriphagus ratkowskyi]PZX50461.1 hypothetical protein LV84_04024 [Algoriphagus ratkowskyi]TXD75729.1 hypothetical protein ESW18_19430 [Algoriphagus ratkowskyi]